MKHACIAMYSVDPLIHKSFSKSKQSDSRGNAPRQCHRTVPRCAPSEWLCRCWVSQVESAQDLRRLKVTDGSPRHNVPPTGFPIVLVCRVVVDHAAPGHAIASRGRSLPPLCERGSVFDVKGESMTVLAHRSQRVPTPRQPRPDKDSCTDATAPGSRTWLRHPDNGMGLVGVASGLGVEC